jgi:hypothetical protein
MDAEQSEQFDASLDSVSDDAHDMDEKRALLATWDGDAVLC